jgi:hypothetical protein
VAGLCLPVAELALGFAHPPAYVRKCEFSYTAAFLRVFELLNSADVRKRQERAIL